MARSLLGHTKACSETVPSATTDVFKMRAGRSDHVGDIMTNAGRSR